MRKKHPLLFVVFAAALLLGSVDCFAAGPMDAQTMECCASMPCTPTNQSHDCCKSTVRAPAVYLVPPAATSAGPVPVAVSDAALPVVNCPALLTQRLSEPLDASAHAPPLELFTIHHSLLI